MKERLMMLLSKLDANKSLVIKVAGTVVGAALGLVVAKAVSMAQEETLVDGESMDDLLEEELD